MLSLLPPGVCVKFYENHTPGILQFIQFAASEAARQSLTEMVKCSRLKFFGHLARSAEEEDLHHVVSAALRPPCVDRAHSVEESKGQEGLATSRQYGNALLRV